MGISETVQWWEEWQLRILVLCSLFLQCFLFFAGALRKRQIPSYLRFLIWLAYLGSDAVAIYALATLFNRNKRSEWVSTHRSIANLQLLWAPILLVHLGGQNGITAYNIEDNELWRRHVLTTGSQVTVAIYVFCKSWSGNKRTLWQGILLFFFGIFKCVLKPFDLKKVSINSLVDPACRSEENGEINSLHQYVRAAAQCFQAGHGGQPSGSPDKDPLEVDKAYDLFVDLAPPYSYRLTCLKYFVNHGEKAHRRLQSCLSVTFDRLYTKEVPQRIDSSYASEFLNWSNYLRSVAASSLMVVISFFHESRKKKEAYYDNIDVKITYTLLWCTLILEYFIGTVTVVLNLMKRMSCVGTIREMIHRRTWPDHVAQYNLIGYLARNKRHPWFRKLAALFGCKDYIDQIWQMKPRDSSRVITELVHGYLARGWMDRHIKDIPSYRAFNDNCGEWILEQESCVSLGWSTQMPFDESVILWHLATDFCFHDRPTAPPPSPTSRQASCRSLEISNYMACLLFVNPEMLMTGAKRSVFRTTYRQLKRTLKLKVRPPQPQGNDAAPLQENMPREETQEGEFARKIAWNIQHTEDNVSEDISIVRKAWSLAEGLKDLGTQQNEEKMWEVIQGVWVEMLCFSAGRCRGYLHAKSLGQGGEYLSYIWLLLSFMGMETLAERMQRTKVQEDAGNNDGGTAAASPVVAGGGGSGTAAAIPVTVNGSQLGCCSPNASNVQVDSGSASAGSHGDDEDTGAASTTTNTGGDSTTADSATTATRGGANDMTASPMTAKAGGADETTISPVVPKGDENV